MDDDDDDDGLRRIEPSTLPGWAGRLAMLLRALAHRGMQPWQARQCTLLQLAIFMELDVDDRPRGLVGVMI